MLTAFEKELVEKTTRANQLIEQLARLKYSDAASKYAFAFGMQTSFITTLVVYERKEKTKYIDNFIAHVEKQIAVLEKL